MEQSMKDRLTYFDGRKKVYPTKKQVEDFTKKCNTMYFEEVYSSLLEIRDSLNETINKLKST